MKPTYYFYKLQISPIKIFLHMTAQFIPKNKLNHSGYILKRINIIKNLQYITNKLRFRRQTFFLALSYLDYIFSNPLVNNEMKPEIVALTALVMAGKFFFII